MSVAATKRPQSSNCGSTIAGMNCTAWNSVVANALTNRPSAIPSVAFADRERDDRPLRPGDVQTEQPEGEQRDDRRLHAASSPKATP